MTYHKPIAGAASLGWIMCGIAGVCLWQPGGAPASTAAALAEMARRLAHRGPDGQGFHEAGGVGLAHTRLAIIDLSGGAQPLYNEDRSLALVANGEVYNYVELRAELEALGHRFATHSDCETILHAYEAWGDGFLERLSGMYAFALHDLRAGQVLLARDRLGIKPLYFARRDGAVHFASELKALLPFLDRAEVDPAGLAQFLQNNFTCAPRTLMSGVEKARPGEVIRIGADGAWSRRRYWTPLAAPAGNLGLEEAMVRFDDLMAGVITEHLRTDVPFGLFLSGGVDSSLLAALIAHRLDEPLRTFSIGFPGTSVHNELDAARRVAERFATRHTALEVSAEEMLERLPHAVWAADDLTADYANLPVSLLAEKAGAELKVVFSGEGGDESFAGYGRYRQPRLKRWLAGLWHPGSGGFRTRGVCARAPAGLYRPELARAMAAWRQPFQEAWQATPGAWSDLARMQYVDLETWLPDDLLVKADRMLMAWGVEGRVPFLDHRLVEFGLSLPDGLKIDARGGKRFLKLWGERFLPHEHLWARKKGFTVPVRDWLRGERLERLARVLPATRAMKEWFAAPALAELLERQRRRGDVSAPVWSLLNFALWHRLFVEGEGAAPPARMDPLAFLAA